MESFQIKTISSGDSEVSFCPSRGGMIISLKLKGKEIFYFDKETFLDSNLSVRGGIPILFPNAGELPVNNIFPNLHRHGFARNMEWSFEQCDNYFNETLISNEETKKFYPYDFKLTINGIIEDDTFVLSETIENTGDVDLPVSSGLHPYFYVKDDKKSDIIFNFLTGEYVKDNAEVWKNGGTLSVDNTGENIEVDLVGANKIILEASKEYKKIWFWSLPDKDFVCIEPVMRDQGGIIDNPEIVKPGQKISLYMKIKLAQ